MDLSPYVDHLRRELAIAAGAGGDEARALAERLAAALESATRLALLEALSAAADEITHDLAPGSVEVRLRGRDPAFVVTPPPSARPFDEDDRIGPAGQPPAPPPPPDADEGGTSRISLRVPEHLKPRIEEAAARDGLSVNAWLVRAVSAALDPGEAARRSGRRPDRQTGNRYSGWVR
ncbi:toxin-antitoxin system HicB family antitoxin [Nonomuraea rhodomycinica]|uniref:Toxin-antitoxin system HicB family antitoxin n=1 Tax=Nonomuraea rhodomycinica TaxID=1712872 RepID=A0A7Y6MC93_9ACTN|nr:toxin-antitoxin system HicB family antitoxin [Nonomuraea rhodomycinica]NUW42557.1 toxin-antitoxin system HicB family antitoxin [Nonomuraea rhodomycinica]